ncbi:unnamed protein product [Blepharisma stoltei]|uniref:Uncharacterized protein n=1 Tax=Blepharisma stoltei TaxID=1481888 RepID=A0AAU9K182_9CILI|nr:unnamed protein product [Blepharisma stoltei]
MILGKINICHSYRFQKYSSLTIVFGGQYSSITGSDLYPYAWVNFYYSLGWTKAPFLKREHNVSLREFLVILIQFKIKLSICHSLRFQKSSISNAGSGRQYFALWNICFYPHLSLLVLLVGYI